ncbi:helix-turn-helix transcriptional regulator [Microcoleus sp. bin38.metabat.b11b12b14.051]|uniref:helix-turn-helix domain-containing protein n=1 Tax=Microcoleus sp. bin38.metabat.b11b12b14.051 TaxID=2742709 RepID=UPI0025F80D61|nr:helix-turn-helix transcriptional regulator [Microcoleus sp. bin38.metabat.b11b12b14.051]
MSGLSNKTVVDNRQELRPVRFTETGPMRLGKILKVARRETGWSVSETEFKTKGYEEALFTATNQPVPRDVGISAATVNRYERGKLDNLDWRSLSLLCFVLKPIDPITNQPLEPTNALYIACEHPPYNDAQLYEE